MIGEIFTTMKTDDFIHGYRSLMDGVTNLSQSSIDLIGKGGFIMITICSVIALAIIIERSYFF